MSFLLGFLVACAGFLVLEFWWYGPVQLWPRKHQDEPEPEPGPLRGQRIVTDTPPPVQDFPPPPPPPTMAAPPPVGYGHRQPQGPNYGATRGRVPSAQVPPPITTTPQTPPGSGATRVPRPLRVTGHRLDAVLVAPRPDVIEANDRLDDSADAYDSSIVPGFDDDPAPDPPAREPVDLTPPAPRGRKHCPLPECNKLLNAKAWADHDHIRALLAR